MKKLVIRQWFCSPAAVVFPPLCLHKHQLCMSPHWQQVVLRKPWHLYQWLILLFISIFMCGLLISRLSWPSLREEMAWLSPFLPPRSQQRDVAAFSYILACQCEPFGRCTHEIWLCRRDAASSCVRIKSCGCMREQVSVSFWLCWSSPDTSCLQDTSASW